MKADEWVKQYQAKVIPARELVEGVWEYAKFTVGVCGGAVYIGPFRHGWQAKFSGDADTAWTAAADFTISRIEEIRQRQNQYVQLGADNIRDWSSMESFVICEGLETAAFWATAWVRRAMVMALLEEKIAELSRGVRPEAL